MFELEQLIADCRACLAERSLSAVKEVVSRVMTEPGAVLRALGEPARSGVTKLYHSVDLTILNVVWGPHMTIYPHNHRMWAVIGVYGGREDNIFWRRLPGPARAHIEAAGAKALSTGDTEVLGRDLIHSVTNPIPRLTGAIHIYGGDFFGVERNEWDPETLLEGEYDVSKAMKLFEAANKASA